MNNVSTKAQNLRREAYAILEGGVLVLLERHLGHVEIAGSVALDLMAVPDIDLYVRLEAEGASKMLNLLPELTTQLDRQGYSLAKIAFNDEHLIPDPNFPDSPGLYSGLTFVNRRSSTAWKLDLWGWDERFYDVRHAQHTALFDRLQAADRDLILHLKETEGYGSRFFSVDVYDFALSDRQDTPHAFEKFLLERQANC